MAILAMITRLTSIYSLAILLFTWNVMIKKGDYFESWQGRGPAFIENMRFELQAKFKRPELADLFLGYTTGYKGRLAHEIKTVHGRLGLVHLLSPGGIHWSAAMVLFFPLLFALRSRKRAHGLLHLLLSAAPLALSGFYPLKRIALMRLAGQLLGYFKCEIDWFYLFLIVFVFDFFLGTYRYSPLSFTLSFLFIGIIMAESTGPWWRLALALLGGQVIAQFFISDLAVAPLAIMAGLVVTQIFALLFPLFCVGLLCSLVIVPPGLEMLLSIWMRLLSCILKLCAHTESYNSSLILLSVCIIFSCRVGKWTYVGMGLLLFQSNVVS